LLATSTIPISSSVRAYSRAPVDLPVRGLDASLQGSIFVRRGCFGELFMQGEHLLHQEGHAVVAGDIGGVGLSESAIAD